MYIIKTFKEDIRIDSDEINVLIEKSNAGAPLIFFRQGAVNPKHIVAVIEDVERKSEFVKLPGDTDEKILKRIESDRSKDIFEHLRQDKQLTLPRLS